jgi:predicted ATPase
VYISQFQIWNNKSFRETEPVALTRGINIVTGQNNVGKTALLQALRLDWEFTPHRSIKSVPVATTPIVDPVSVAVTVTVSSTEFRSVIAGHQIWVPVPRLHEQFPDVPVMHDHTGSLTIFKDWFFSRETYTFQLWRERSANSAPRWTSYVIPSFGLYETDSPNPVYVAIQIDLTGNPTLGGMVHGRDRSDEVGILFAGHLSQLIYRFEAERFNMGVCGFGSNPVLSPRATNLPEVLAILQGNAVAFDNFNQIVCEVLPQVGRITVVPEGTVSQKILVWTETARQAGRVDLAVALNDSGTGIGQVLAIAYLLITSKTPQVMLIDEPQSFLHPGAVRKLIEILKRHPIHQYVISTHSPTIVTSAKPDTIILITHDGNESKIQHLDATDADQLRRYLDEIGASLADVFGADGIVWVEGITEEKCYPLIIANIIKKPLMGKVIKAVITTGDFEGKHAGRFFQIYNRLSDAQSLIPPAVAFIFDDEGRSDADKKILETRGDHKVHFTQRRMYENYLLDAKAITEVLNTTDGHTKTVTEVDVQDYLDGACKDAKYFKPLDVSRGIDRIRADLVLKKLFWDVAELDYRKIPHSIELTEWLLAHDPAKLDELAGLIRAALGCVSA